MSTDILGTTGGDFCFYCSDNCYFDAYHKLEKLFEKHNHDTKKAWAEFEKEVWGLNAK